MAVTMRTHFGAIWEAIADAVPEQAAVVQGDRRVTWRDYEQRAARMAQALLDAGLGPDSKVGMYLYNSPEYCETNFAAMKVRGVPINVNYRYLDNELHYLLDNADIEALVFHTSLGDRVARVRDRLDRVRLLVEVDDGAGARRDRPRRGGGPLRGSAGDAGAGAANRTARRRDCTSSTPVARRACPRASCTRCEEFTQLFLRSYPPMIGLRRSSDPNELPATAMRLYRGRHAARRHVGAAADARHRLLARDDDPAPLRRHRRPARGTGLDPVELWDAVEREGVQHLIVVGDAFAKPLLRALDDAPDRWDLSSPAFDDVVGGHVLRRGEARPDRAHPGAGDRRRPRFDRGRHGHVHHDQGHAAATRRRKFP